jgi:hypothetical protein
MQLPQTTAGYRTRVRFARYVLARLQRAQRDTPALKATLEKVKAAGRKAEDLEEEVDAALAQRDASDDALDAVARTARRHLAARSATATQEAPFTSIFPSGLGYYTDATLDDNAAVYAELKARLEAHLPAGDAIRGEAVGQLDTLIPTFEAAEKAVAAARTALAVASTQLDAAEDDLDRLLEKVYGTLIVDLGKASAEAFFPKLRGASRRRSGSAGDAGGDAAAPA